MSQWEQFFWLCKIAAEFLLFPPFLIAAALLGASTAAACIKQRPFQSGRWRPSYWWVFSQLLFYPAVLGVAVLGGMTFTPRPEPNHLASQYTDILSWLSLGLAAFWVWRMKGLRWLAFSLVALQELLLFFAFITADMAISGRWL